MKPNKMTNAELIREKNSLLEELGLVVKKKKDADIKVRENYSSLDLSVSKKWADKRDEAVVEARRLNTQLRIVLNELSNRRLNWSFKHGIIKIIQRLRTS